MQLHRRRFLRRNGRKKTSTWGSFSRCLRERTVRSNEAGIAAAGAPERAAKRRSASSLMNLPSQRGTNCCPGAETSHVRGKIRSLRSDECLTGDGGERGRSKWEQTALQLTVMSSYHLHANCCFFLLMSFVHPPISHCCSTSLLPRCISLSFPLT